MIFMSFFRVYVYFRRKSGFRNISLKFIDTFDEIIEKNHFRVVGSKKVKKLFKNLLFFLEG
jgi:hypothetical protein